MRSTYQNLLTTGAFVGITLAACAWGGVCKAAEPAPAATSLGQNLPDQLTLMPLPARGASAMYLDDATSQPAAESNADAESAATLAKKTLNPVSDLISVPFQYNADFNIGPSGATRSLLNIQPVIPISISDNFNLIIRTIIPLINIDSVADGVPSRNGMGDILQSFFFSPKQKLGGWIVGFGPACLWPTATNDALGSGKFAIGPTAVALRQDGPWTYGALVSQIWSYAGDSDRTSVNQMFLQPFVSYTFPTFTSITLNTESSYTWESHQTVIPINLIVQQILKIGKQPIALQIGPRYYAENTPGGAQWGMRFTFTLLLPK